MNKYQDALDWLMAGHDSCGGEWDLLQELVYKMSPRRPKIHQEFRCVCGNQVDEYQEFCSDCGQRLDWSDEELDWSE